MRTNEDGMRNIERYEYIQKPVSPTKPVTMRFIELNSNLLEIRFFFELLIKIL